MGIQMGLGGTITNLVSEDTSASLRMTQVQNRVAKQRAAIENFEATLPGNKQITHPVDLQGAVEDLERISLAFNKKLKFKVDPQSHEVTVKIIDSETNKVIKELPSKELQRLRDRIRETIGVLFDEQV